MSNRVRVTPRRGAEDYDVIIEHGALANIRERLPKAHAYAIIADTNVAPLYAKTIEQRLPNAVTLTFKAGETNKSANTWQALTDQLIASGAGRDTCVIALGGGVTGDLAGFVAATYMRGIPVVQVPTTLLAMIDASIGGKTGIDIEGGKNLVGAFHQPHAVIIDPQVLKTLPAHELRYGLAEAIKHGAIADADYLAFIMDHIREIEALETERVLHLVKRSVEIKAHYVSDDVHENGARAALNFGHTIGHALERVTRYALAHGDAVAIGMLVELMAGEAAGVTESGSSGRLQEALRATGLPTTLPETVRVDDVLEAARTDKKAREGDIRYSIPGRIGEFSADENGRWTRTLPGDVVTGTLARLSIT